jgi:chorismate mutase / prephenate dehydratase
MLENHARIHIVGGTGAMGTWLRKFFVSLKFQVSVSDENSGTEKIKDADLIFISVPIEIAPRVITETANIARKDSLLVDLSSVKNETSKALKKSGRQVLSMHMLFGPSVSSIQNQKIIVEKISKSFLADGLIELLKQEGAVVFDLTADEHDFVMAHIQSLTHFINLSLAKILIKNKIGVRGSISTPVFLSQISSTLRVLSQNPRLLSEIQTHNPKFLKIVSQFMDIQNEFIAGIKKREVLKLEREFLELAENMESVSGINIKTKKPDRSVKVTARNLKVGFLGPEGTFSNQAASELFGPENKLVAAKNIYDLFGALNDDAVDLIVAPYENTIEGTVRETLDLLFDYDFKVIGKIDLEISQNLLSKEKELESINKVISHPQAINQSRQFLSEKLPGVKIETSPSTIASVGELGEPGVAIIGSKLAAKIYKLNILAENIQNKENNITRFYVISKQDKLNLKNRTKTLLFLSVFNRVGILRDILSVFADLSINLNKIESRPSKEKNWDYYFYIEVEITDEDPRLEQALNILKQYCPAINILGKL